MGKSLVIITGVVLLLLAGAGVYYFLKPGGSVTPTTDVQVTQEQNVSPSDSASTGSESGLQQSNVKEFTITGSPFKFDKTTLSVNNGDKVKITFVNSNGMHDFVIDDFNVKTKVLQAGAQETVEFTADKAGTFEYYCSVGNHRAQGMKGTLVVQ